MKNSLKRCDTISFGNPQQTNFQKEMSELLQIKNHINTKLAPMTRTIEKDVSNFVTKHYPHQTGKFSLIEMECNLFGTNRTFLQFSNNYKAIFHSLQADIKGVVQVLEKFPTTRNLSLFINEGIVDNLLKLNKLMLYRQEHCQKILQQLQQNILKNKPLYSTKNNQSQLCHKCQSHLQHQNIIQTKQMMLFGGQKIYNYYKKSIESKLVTESDEDQQAQNYIGSFYDRMIKIKRNVKKSIANLEDDQLITQETMKFTLDKLQSNLQQRKYDILACLVEMGQFGTQISNSFSNIQKDPKTSKNPQQQLPQLTQLLPKFNYKQFTFDLGKHFCKQIKDIQHEISKIKNKYSDLLTHQMSKLVTKQTQCNLIKDSFDQQMDKQKKKTQKQINLLHGRIHQLQQTNKMLKGKLQENFFLTRNNLKSRKDLGRVEVQKKAIQETMHELVDKYETKLKYQQSELKALKIKEITLRNQLSQYMEQSIEQKQPSSMSIPVNNSCLITSTKIEENPNEKNIYNLTKYGGWQKGENKKKILMFLQPITKSSNSNINENTTTNAQTNHKKRVSVELPKSILNSNVTSEKGITQLTIENYINSTCQMIESVQLNDNGQTNPQAYIQGQNKLSLNYQIITIQIHPQSFADDQQNRSLQAPHFASIYIKKSLEQRQNNLILNNTTNKRLPTLKSKSLPKHKLLKAKSYQDSKFYKNYEQYEDKINSGKPQNNAQLLKKYASEHSTYLKNINNLSSPIRKTLKDNSDIKNFKTLSLTMIKKQDFQSPSNSLKLPSLSQYEKINKYTQKVKNTQKLQKLISPNKNGSLLTKKKRKRRNFTQQRIGSDSIFENNMAMSLGTNQIKSKKKKQYIIDFIPKVQEQSMSKYKEEYQKIVKNHVERLFSVQNGLSVNDKTKRGLQQNDKQPKSKNNSKTMIVASKSPLQQSPNVTSRLSNNQISLSTKLYSVMASIKSSNLSLYLLIRQKLQEEYKRDQKKQISMMRKKIKTNCDEGVDKKEGKIDEANESQGTSHMPLSLDKKKDNEVKDSSFEVKNRSLFHTVSTNTNQIDEENYRQKEKEKQLKKIKQSEEKQLRRIINSMIIRHRNNVCQEQTKMQQRKKNQDKQGNQNKQNYQNLTYKHCCKHISQFYQFLNECKMNK